MDQYANLIQQSVAQNNAWSAEQAQKQMDFQERMSNTAHQREIADLKASGLNPVLSAKLGGASTPTGAMAQGDTSGTSALVDLLQLSMETANSAAGAARAAVSGAARASASTVQDNSAFGLSDPGYRSTADVFGMELGEDGNYHFSKTQKSKLNNAKQRIYSVLNLLPVGSNTAKAVVNFAFANAEDAINTVNKAYTFKPSSVSQLEANRRRLQIDNHKSVSTSNKKAFGGR